MYSAVLFPLSLGILYFCTVFAYLDAARITAPGQPLAIALSAVLTLVFGWLYRRGIRSGEESNPLVPNRGRNAPSRRAFAVTRSARCRPDPGLRVVTVVSDHLTAL